MRHSLNAKPEKEAGASLFNLKHYLPLGPRTRRFSLPEPRAHYDSEDFMRKSNRFNSSKSLLSRKNNYGLQQSALSTMRSPILVMNSVVGIDTKKRRENLLCKSSLFVSSDYDA
ncbi:hypothetical protein Ciccas_003421 [Cichlidogyrus casuarinus]|uniref:Uncharacterized protein n=1 Tax=Cichlidogyrus casuarinus TaxID=1844966 RepID=A0ABD2QEG6_9PLAT